MSHWTFGQFGIKERMKFFEVELVFIKFTFFSIDFSMHLYCLRLISVLWLM